jgi:peptidylprolyl isomerase
MTLKGLAVVTLAASFVLNGCNKCSGETTSPSDTATGTGAAATAPAPATTASEPSAPPTPPAAEPVATSTPESTAASSPPSAPSTLTSTATDASPTSATAATSTKTATSTATTAVAKPHKFESKDLKVGAGPVAADGKTVTIHYVGTFEDGAKFDSSVDRESPLSFELGKGQQIKGWDQGIKGMKVGGKRRLVIPPELGYGDKGVKGVIPPNATLFFEIELLGVQ